ncbi:MAG: PQQ-binding-like beta-propeller repeat protein [Sarcina sp.]
MKKLFLFGIIILGTMLIGGCGNTEKNVSDIKKEEIQENVDFTKINDKNTFKEFNLAELSQAELKHKLLNEFKSEDIIFDDQYSDVEGILTFRGNNFRTAPSYGKVKNNVNSLGVNWKFTTGSSSWGGGAGWTGQPSIVKWTKEQKEYMNLSEENKNNSEFIEVIYASLDGNIYFLNLKTGEQTRKKIFVGNPIKGSLSIDPRGYPLLYVGEGINEGGNFGFNIYSLVDGRLLYEIASDADAPRAWGAFDSSPLIDKKTDTLFVLGENGIVYKIKLNTKLDENNKSISIKPLVSKYIYDAKGYAGIESSLVAYSNLGYFADNKGGVQCINLNSMKPIWLDYTGDDTDATIVLDIEKDNPFIYTGNEVDHQGERGISTFKKIDGLTGETIWKKEYPCESLVGKDPVNGGMLSTPVVGKGSISNLVIASFARYEGFNKGLLVAMNKKNGQIVWKKNLDAYAWSSPVDFYDENGAGYILQGDSIGNLILIDGETGGILDTLKLDANIEASPAIFDGKLVVATRNGTIYGIDIK